MVIGVAREIKNEEYRVGLLPRQAGILKMKGHRVMVETKAGRMAGYTDDMYRDNGAETVPREKLFSSCDMIIKVKCPLEPEYDLLKNGQILFTYLHFDENIPAENILKMVSRKITAIAYEWVIEKGEAVLLKPMSEITGILFALQSMRILMESKGIIPAGSMNGIPDPSAIVIGMGRIGSNAARILLANGFFVTIVEKDTGSIEERAAKYIGREAWRMTKDKRKVIPFDTLNPSSTVEEIKELLPSCDILINCAVRGKDLPKSRMEYLVTREMVSTMKKGSVLCDATACDRDMIETSVSSEKLNETYEVDGVVHYSCDHIPSLVPGTSSEMLSSSTFPYVETIAGMGFEKAVKEKPSLLGAVMCHDGRLTHGLTAEKKKMEWTNIGSLL